MKTQRLLIGLTFINLALLIFSFAQPRPVVAQGVAPVLRGRALEIVDDRGRVRASISALPANPKFTMPNGQPYPETVLLRLISPQGAPNVKLQASELGGGLGLGGQSAPTYASLGAQRTSATLKLTNKDGRQQIITP